MQEKESSCSFTCGNTAQERGLSYVPDCFISNKFFIIFLTLLLMVYCTRTCWYHILMALCHKVDIQSCFPCFSCIWFCSNKQYNNIFMFFKFVSCFFVCSTSFFFVYEIIVIRPGPIDWSSWVTQGPDWVWKR
jgi:hypothetical protein